MNKYASIFAAIKAAEQRTGHEIDRREVIYELTSGRTDSLKDLSTVECAMLVSNLQSMDSPEAQKADKMRKKIISLLMFQGYTLPDGKPDMPRMYALLEKYGYLKKSLNDYKYAELPKLVFQVEQMKKSYIAKQ